MSILGVLLHRYIRSGETVLLYQGQRDASPSRARVTVEGWGKYAVVRLNGGPGAIRRDGITKDAAGNWFYRYDD